MNLTKRQRMGLRYFPKGSTAKERAILELRGKRKSRNLGRKAARRGKRAEKQFLDAWRDMAHYPEWLVSVRRATEHEDRHEKTDAVMATSGGSIRIQIKSGPIPEGKRKRLRAEGVVPLTVSAGETPERTRSNTLAAIARFKNEALF